MHLHNRIDIWQNQIMSQNKTLITIFLFCILSIGITACNPFASSTDRSIRAALEKEYNQDLCRRYSMIYPFELAPIPMNRKKITQADIMMDAGLLKKEEKRRYFKGAGYLKVNEYALTKKGASLLNDDYELCYGKQYIEDILAIDMQSETAASVTFVVNQTSDQNWIYDKAFTGFANLDDPKTLKRMVYQSKTEEWTVGR